MACFKTETSFLDQIEVHLRPILVFKKSKFGLKGSNLALKRSNSIEYVLKIRIRPNLTFEFGLCNSKFRSSNEFVRAYQN